MIITLTGAYRNAGDHLIGDRAIKLLKKYVDKNVINIDRKKIKPEHYALFNQADAIILCGGPAYQKMIYPGVYPLDYKKIKTPIIPMGLGWKGAITDTPKKFKFTAESKKFIKAIHKRISHSSVRDDLTLDVIKNLKLDNILMTGCPAWYDLEYIKNNFKFKTEKQIKKIAFSTPAIIDKNTIHVMKHLSKRFPDATKICTFHHGFYTGLNLTGVKKALGFIKAAFYAKKYGFKVADLNSDLKKIHIYDDIDLHIGYRVHAHIYMLSHRRPSFIIAEDSRATGQSLSMGLPAFNYDSPQLAEELDQSLNHYFQSKGKDITKAVEKMNKTFEVMKTFLKSIK
ncbi:MAG: polysaccharide pyruvyl transferase family protein [Alphaproteobacteria bacterium]